MRLSSFSRCAIAGTLLVLTGCPGTPGGTGLPGLNIGSTLNDATALTLDSAGKVNISGNITGNKVDVYDIGAVNPGDHITVHVNPAGGGSLDPTTAIFDENGELFEMNDDADDSTVASTIDDYVVKSSTHFYVATTKFFSNNAGGAYEGDVQVVRNQTIPKPLAQVLLLNFSGGSITIPNEGTFNFGVFDAADIDSSYAGKTAAIKVKIVETVKQNFVNFGITVVTSDEQAVPAGICDGTSVIHFGAFSSTKFGIAQDVDEANRNRCDDGIVYTNDFDKPFSPKPSSVGIAIAIGNVAAHEAGHLLGLNHVADVSDLMDTTGSASTLLADQEFKSAPLSPTIFPFGTQNGVTILNRVIPKAP